MSNRIIKESIRTSRSVNSMTDFQFRLWVYLITYVDDYGRGSADPELLKGLVFPRRKTVTESSIDKALAELEHMGCLSLYSVDGEDYLCFPNWGDHQRIQNRKSKYPAPEDGASLKLTVSHGESPPESNPNPESNPDPNPKENSRASRFAPPTEEEVRAYCEERNNGIDPKHFVDFYASKGWKVGNAPMKDWKACVRVWESRDPKNAPKSVTKSPQKDDLELLKKILDKGEAHED